MIKKYVKSEIDNLPSVLSDEDTIESCSQLLNNYMMCIVKLMLGIAILTIEVAKG